MHLAVQAAETWPFNNKTVKIEVTASQPCKAQAHFIALAVVRYFAIILHPATVSPERIQGLQTVSVHFKKSVVDFTVQRQHCMASNR